MLLCFSCVLFIYLFLLARYRTRREEEKMRVAGIDSPWRKRGLCLFPGCGLKAERERPRDKIDFFSLLLFECNLWLLSNCCIIITGCAILGSRKRQEARENSPTAVWYTPADIVCWGLVCWLVCWPEWKKTSNLTILRFTHCVLRPVVGCFLFSVWKLLNLVLWSN